MTAPDKMSLLRHDGHHTSVIVLFAVTILAIVINFMLSAIVVVDEENNVSAKSAAYAQLGCTITAAVSLCAAIGVTIYPYAKEGGLMSHHRGGHPHGVV